MISYFHIVVFVTSSNSIMTPQYGHSLVVGIGGNNNLLLTWTDLASKTSMVESAYGASTAIYRAVVALVVDTGARVAAFGLSSVAGAPEPKPTAETLSGILRS